MGDRIIFEKRWKKFVEENGLDTNYFLTCRQLHFTVTIFDRSSCEKAPCVDKSPATPTAYLIADKDHWQSVDVDMEEKCTRTKAWDAPSSLKTTNLTLKKMVTESVSYHMHIPADSPNASLPNKTCQVKLEDPDGRQWPVKFMMGINSKRAHSLPCVRRSLGSGWRNFFEENRLKKRDVCVFEFIAGKKLFNVHNFWDGTQ